MLGPLLVVSIVLCANFYHRDQREQVNDQLIAAIRSNDLTRVRLLLHQGADPNAPVSVSGPRSLGQRFWDTLWKRSSRRTIEGDTALYEALAYPFWGDEKSFRLKTVDNAETVQALVDAGANVNVRTDSWKGTPLEGNSLNDSGLV